MILQGEIGVKQKAQDMSTITVPPMSLKALLPSSSYVFVVTKQLPKTKKMKMLTADWNKARFMHHAGQINVQESNDDFLGEK